MIRSFAHLLLILVVLACPVQCVIGGDLCCGSQSTEADTGAEQTCPSADHCCHTMANASQSSDSTDEAPTHIPQSDDDCNCDCLCKGATSSASLLAKDCGATLLHCQVVYRTASTDVSRHSGMLQADSPDALSGREIRTLRMSFQV